jgi:hypothetical protein
MDLPKSEEVLKKAGVLTIEEYIQRRREKVNMLIWVVSSHN